MQYIACVSFSSYNLSMTKGEVREINDPALVADLLGAGFIAPFEATNVVDEEKEEKPKETKRKGKTK